MTKWVAFFSQTGSEIVNIAEKLGKWPSVVVCSNKDLSKVNKKLLDHYQDSDRFVHLTGKIDQYAYYDVFNRPDLYGEQFIITLNGWLKIVPPKVCEDFMIYNGHPGLITDYPELKGKDPQQRVVDLIEAGTPPDKIGSVIHVVTPEVDEGSIVRFKEIECPALKEDVFTTLHSISTELWVEFLQPRLLGFNYSAIIKLCIAGLWPYYRDKGLCFFDDEYVKNLVSSVEPLAESIHPWELIAFSLKRNFGTSV